MTSPTNPPSAASLPDLPSRGRTYAFLAGVVATLLTVSVAIPLALGDRPDTGAGDGGSLALGGSDLASGAPAPGEPLAPGASLPPGASPAPGLTGPGGAVAPGGSGGDSGGTGGGLSPDGSGGGSGGSTGSAGSTGGSGRSGGVARTASDQGVTATTLKVGAFLVDFGEATGLGAVVGYDVETQRRFVNAFVADTNAKGGVGGRKLVAVFRKVDIVDPQTMRDACTSFGQTDKVFAVFQVLGVYGDPILKCAVDQKLPFISNDGAVSSYYSQARGYLITTQPSTLRTLLNMEHELNRLGEYKGKKLGVLYEDGYLLDDSKAVVTALKRRGITPVEGVTSSSDVALALRQIPVIAQDFCSKGVDYVLLLVNELYADQFHSNAERFANCRPSYAVSDFDFQMNGDAFLDGQNPSFFNRVVSVSSGRVGEGRVGKPEPAVDAACRKGYETQTRSRLDRNAVGSDYFNAMAVCGLLTVLKRGFETAGVNPTRASFVASIARIGAFPNPGYGASAFTARRYDAPEVVRISRAFLNCKCWRPQTDHFPATFR